MNRIMLWLKDIAKVALTPREEPMVIRGTRYVKPHKHIQLHKYDKTRSIRLTAPRQ